MTEEKTLSKKSILYGVLFALCILMIFRLIHPIACLVLIVAVLAFVDRKALKNVDYGLLFTFVFFFIFAGNVSRIDVISNFIKPLLEKK